MKKLAATTFTLFLALSISRANTIQNLPPSTFQKHFESKTQTPTKNALARAVPKAQRRFLKVFELDENDNNGPAGPDELDMQGPYGRNRFIEKRKNFDTDDTVSDYVAVRLALARAKAMAKYREVWG
jgi:hypothetical protein